MSTLRVLTSAIIVGTLAQPGAQTDQDATMVAPILRTERAGSGIIRIVYDLPAIAGGPFTVSLEASDDGGQTFAVRPRAISGDVGRGITSGREKTIAWDSAKDVDDLRVDRYVFRVRVTASGENAAEASPPAASGARRSGRGANDAAPANGTGATKKGTLGKGAIFGILGGAAAAGVGVAVGKGGTGANPTNGTPNSTPPGVVTTAVIDVSPPSGAGIRAVTNYSFAGSAPNLAAGTYDWDFGDGVTGSGQTATHVYGGNGTFRVTLKITSGSQQVTGSATVAVGDLTGTWVHALGADIGEVTLSLVQQGAMVAGQWRHRDGGGHFNTVPFHGTVSSPRSVQLFQDGECLDIANGAANEGLTQITAQRSRTSQLCNGVSGTPMPTGALNLIRQ